MKNLLKKINGSKDLTEGNPMKLILNFGLPLLFGLVGENAPITLLPAWLEREKGTLKGTVAHIPTREEIDTPVEEHLIVELYSK